MAGKARVTTAARQEGGESTCSTCEEPGKPRVAMLRKQAAGGDSKESSACHTEETGFGPDGLHQEELELRLAREKKLQEEATSRETAVPLGKKRFASLDDLLDKAQLYVQFLTEAMDTHKEEQAGLKYGAKAGSKAESAESSQTQVGGKRKGRAGGAAAKRQKKEAEQEQEGEFASVEEQERAQTKALAPLVQGTLRGYQLKGVAWLLSLYANGMNGILADQMGLGKTLQAITFLANLRGKGMYGPYLIVGPLSTLPNWVAEYKRWVPSIPVLLYHGTKEARAALREEHMPLGPQARGPKFPVVCTSYEILMADVAALRRYPWKFLVVDEGHRLKNANCRLLRELRQLPVENKLLLTGTPLQNNLSELWSLLNFLLPDLFTDLADFQGWFDTALNTDNSAAVNDHTAYTQQRDAVAEKLQRLLRPFLLRRVKSDVETSIPGKAELLLYAPETELQARINRELRERTLNEAEGRDGARLTVSRLNNVLMQMRKNCNHPDLIQGGLDGSIVYPPAAELVGQCGKLALLERLLARLHGAGHKVLIFSQMTRMLDVLDTYLDQTQRPAVRLDGAVSWEDRQAAITRFKEDPAVQTFLLSTRAGGLGINLTSADTCIIYDSDWNPHQDLQAMDRCHRIGQTKPVLVLRLATAHSVEGQLLARAASKLALERLVIKKGAFLPGFEDSGSKPGNLNSEELLGILKSEGADRDEAQDGVVSDEVLDQLLDRSHLEKGVPAPYPPQGVGYRVAEEQKGTGLLSGVE